MSALNILLVDDDQNLVTTLSHGLRKAMGDAIMVDVCHSGSEALSIIPSQGFDLVISDFHLPGMSGLELLTAIRQNHRETTLLLVTAYGNEELEKEACRLAIGYISKPFELQHLVQLIHGLIWGKGAGGNGRNTDSQTYTRASDVRPENRRGEIVIDHGGSNA